ncbi:cyclohexanone monooxygenase [Talaromyces proteolyticus]|uniref:Cyclohexanone monooxygenase n=1 Tax=Talaromyces proteolyticus TaxID=1131652 RepID=A0AAD4KNI3_9EURO|nr:cyclohexanone monooxygenase [Talaromyces proteolyticus]KAH8695626.1 cyclohexanone monooxygenase [Talaromyces proteolyticus]
MGSINQSIPDFETLPEKYGWVTDNGKGYKIKEALFGTERSLKVIALGAGAAGICLAKYLPLQLRNVSLSIYDKNPEVGGTWYENRYPGCACDIPSHIYQFSWAKNPHWSKFYSEGPEILEYFKNVVERFNLSQYINLNHEVIDATWDSDRGQWDIRIKNLLTGTIFIDTCNVFLNCGGILNAWRWPDIEGINTFQGKLCHTANYDPNTDLKDKRVAVIGIGSSGVQVIPKIVNEVDHLYCWIRSPTWMTSGFAQKYAGPNGENFNYSDEQKQYFAKNSEEYLEYCKNLEIEIHQVFKSVQLGSPESRLAKEFSSKEMKNKLAHRTDIMERIIPTTFEVGCRRPTPGNGFLEALTLDKVTTYLDSVKKITRKGFIDTDGNEQEVDVIICATGFDTSWVPRFPIVANGKNLQDIQRKKPISYLSMAVPGMPNYFTIGGPYFSFGHGSYTTMVELFIDNILSIIKKLQKENIKSMSPQQSATEDFIDHADIWLKRTAWAGPCPSWFKNGTVDGVLTIFPGSRMVLANLLECPRYEDYDIEYLSKNRFSFMGNGFSTKEYDGSDAAWYLALKKSDNDDQTRKHVMKQH